MTPWVAASSPAVYVNYSFFFPAFIRTRGSVYVFERVRGVWILVCTMAQMTNYVIVVRDGGRKKETCVANEQKDSQAHH